MYELFLKTHLSLVLLLVGLLWYHIPVKNKQALAYLLAATGLWLLQHFLWLGYFCYWNTGSRRSSVVGTPYRSGRDRVSEVMVLTISTKMSHQILPGHYIYLTIPRLTGSPLSFIQAHPYVVAWIEGSHCTLLIQRYTGFSNNLFNATRVGPRALIDGPYGHAMDFDGYEKVVFMASGIGIAAHLLPIKVLIEACNAKATRVRRISLHWVAESSGM